MNFQYSVSTLFREFSPLQPEGEREKGVFIPWTREYQEINKKNYTTLPKKNWARLATLIGTVEFNV